MIEPFPDRDTRVRLAAFKFLDDQVRLLGEVLPLNVLRNGFVFDGDRVPLMNAVQGIFKPAVLSDMPLSITTTAPKVRQEQPYDDVMTEQGLLYRYRGQDPKHPDNVGLRLAMTRQRPLVYFHGIVPGQYFPAWPVYIVGDAPAQLTFTVNIDDRQLAGMQPRPSDDDEDEVAGRRRYVTRLVQQRAHQAAFRVRVIEAYKRHCAFCRLRHQELLEAAHILPDGHPRGEPIVPNGLALCALHHGAFDAHILGVTPDYTIEIRGDVLIEKDGPMLLHGLQGFHRKRLQVPLHASARPRREFLEERYALFKRFA
jgi:putative restriction endonuclease